MKKGKPGDMLLRPVGGKREAAGSKKICARSPRKRKGESAEVLLSPLHRGGKKKEKGAVALSKRHTEGGEGGRKVEKGGEDQVKQVGGGGGGGGSRG